MTVNPPPTMTGDDLRALAKQLGYTRAEMAAALGLSLRGYMNQLYGDRPVSGQTARIAELLAQQNIGEGG